MKKLFTLLLAIVMAFVGSNIVTKNTAEIGIDIDTPDTTKAVEWAAGYAARCNRVASVKVNHGKRIARYAVMALALPALLVLGVAPSASSSGKFEVQYELNNQVKSKVFTEASEAVAAYRQLAEKKPNLPRQIRTIGKTSIILANHNWTKDLIRKDRASEYLAKGKTNLEAVKGLKSTVVETVLKLRVSDLKAIVAGRNIEKLMELPGIGEKTAYKIVAALEPITKTERIIRSYGSRKFVRATLNQNTIAFDLDEINKGVSPLEAKAIALGGDNAIIHVKSEIVDPKKDDIEGIELAEAAAELWNKTVHTGLMINNEKYVFLGHGTNSAKECKTLWVKESIFAEMQKWILKGTNANWNTTAAKKIAYLVGLQAVPRKSFGIPFMPEDCAVLPSVFSEIIGNHTKEFLDGHEEKLNDHHDEEIRNDGYGCIDIPEAMVPVYLNRMIANGVDPEEAEERINAFMADSSVVTLRTNGAAIKTCVDRNFRIHQFLKDNGITKMPDGRDIDTISFFMDETVLKTGIGSEKKAYTTFEDWCNAVRSEFDIGVCVKAHGPQKKDTSYQVIQNLTEASDDVIAEMAAPTIKRINDAHTVEGASKMLGRELGHIARILPAFLKERNVNEKFTNALNREIDNAFSGKLLKNAYYAKALPDPVYVAQGWFNLDRTGAWDDGEAWIPGFKFGEFACSRSPVMHPNSNRVLRNVAPKASFRKYFKSEPFCVYFNAKDDTARAFAMDYDGDGVKFSFQSALIKATKQTLEKWNRLVIWEAPEGKKEPISQEAILDYAATLTHRNELGLTVYGENALLNRIFMAKDPVTKEFYTIVVDISERGVNFKVFAANVLVDASKHGGAEIDEPEESVNCRYMLQPWAKEYKDAADAKETRGKLDKLASMANKDASHRVSTLNKLFALYSEQIDRSATIKDLPDEAFDFHKLMWNTEETRRGLSGLIRKGNNPIEIDGVLACPDEGLFNAIARRMESDRRVWEHDETRKDKEDTSFEDEWRVSALAEIQDFAESVGCTLKDAYDVITWQMFKNCDILYSDEKISFFRDLLWRAYWAIFGGMAEEAAMRYEEKAAE